jgi:TPR repeat protein
MTSQADADAFYAAGVERAEAGDLAGAEQFWHEASQASHHRAARELGCLRERQRDLESAADEWAFAAHAPDEDVAVDAIIAYGRLISEHEFSTETVVGKHRNAKTLGGHDTAGADQLWRRGATSTHPDAAWAWIGLGRLYDPTELADDPDPEKSREYFDKAAKSEHPDAAACGLLKLGRLQEHLGRQESRAEGALDAVAALEQGAKAGHPVWSPRCAFQLAQIHANQQNLDEARKWWEVAAGSGLEFAEIAQRQLDDLDLGGADPLAEVDLFFTLPEQASAIEAFDIALPSLGWEGGVEGLGGYSYVRQEGNADHLFCVSLKRLLSGGGGRIEVYIKDRTDEPAAIGLVGGAARDREALKRAMIKAVGSF